jgi:isopenicillin N synthase-like dioxygenase
MTHTIPVIDVADYLAGRPGALQATARALHEALTTVGFLVLTGHDVPQSLITQTFAEAKRLHDLPMASKLASRLNEHNNGSMNITTAIWRWVAMRSGPRTSTRMTRAT